MKYLVQFSRVLVGLLFILSGLLKLNDPTGFSYKLEEYFAVFAGDVEAEQDSIQTYISFYSDDSLIVTPIHKRDTAIEFVVSQGEWRTEVLGTDTLFRCTVDVLYEGGVVVSQGIATPDSVWESSDLRFFSEINKTTVLNQTVTIAKPSLGTQSVSADIRAYVKPDGWAVGLFNWLADYALFMAIFVSWLEAILGFALLIGWQRRFTAWLLVLLTAFFTFLTLYSWVYNKVTDCGCFGDALPMNPEESFYKNVVIGVFIAIIFFWNKHIKPIFSNPFGVKVLTILTLLLVGFSMYCRHYLPLVDFLHYSEGTDIREGMKVPDGERATDHVQTTYVYSAKDGSGATIEVVYDSDKNSFEPKIDYKKWKYDRVKEEKTIAEAYEPPIHDFAFYNADQDNNYIDDFWKADKKLLLIIHDVDKANKKAMKRVNELAKQWKEDGYEFWALTASAKNDVEEFRHEHQISDFEFYYGDNTNLKSIIRSNPGLLLITDTSVVAKVWPSTRLPKYKKILKAAE